MINECRVQAVSPHFRCFFLYAVKPEEIPAGHVATKSQPNLTLSCEDRIFLLVCCSVICHMKGRFGMGQIRLERVIFFK